MSLSSILLIFLSLTIPTQPQQPGQPIFENCKMHVGDATYPM